MRDLNSCPYSRDEQRVCAYLREIMPDIGCGDDPVGFLIASHHALVERRQVIIAGGKDELRPEDH